MNHACRDEKENTATHSCVPSKDARVAARPASLGDIGRAFLPASVDFRFWARGQGRNQGRAQTAHAAPAAGAGERRTSRPRHEEDDVWGEVRGASRDAGFSSPATSQSQRGGRRYKAPEEDPWGELSPGRERGRRDDRPHSRQVIFVAITLQRTTI